jgi:two-component system, chemotaxis family, chemotaxis protein CheY
MPLKLMTVDDSRTIRRIVATYAKELAPDVEIIEAANGQECVDKCKEVQPDIIILDVNMPVMTGEECLQALRASDKTKNIPVVMLTTESEKTLVVRLLQMGVQQFIIKPFEKQEFSAKVGGVLAKMPKHKAVCATKTPEGKYIIVVEDKEHIAAMIVEAAKGKYEAVVTTDTAEALNHLRKKAPQIVLANLSMDKADAFEMFVQMRKVPERAEVRYIGMCLKTAGELIHRARGTGYIEVLTKPFAADDVLGLLTSSAKGSVQVEVNKDIYIIRSVGGTFQSVLSIIMKSIDQAAEEGFGKVLIDLTNVAESELGDVTLWGTIAEKTHVLGMKASYVSPSTEVVRKLKGLVDTADLVVCTGQGEAIQALAA